MSVGGPARATEATRLRLRVRGAVQGVGFRPYVYGLATRLSLTGFVANDPHGVVIEIEGERTSDFVAVAERFLGAPYLWGGKTVAGLDCSGLIQTAMAAAGKRIPRDTDMQEDFFTASADTPRRGDLIFWKGHMGVMLDTSRLLHANAFHMMVAIEPLAEALARIEQVVGKPTSMKRPS